MTLPECIKDLRVSAVERIAAGGIEIRVSDIDTAREAVPAAVAAERLGLIRFDAGEVTLEEVFVDLVGGA